MPDNNDSVSNATSAPVANGASGVMGQDSAPVVGGAATMPQMADAIGAPAVAEPQVAQSQMAVGASDAPVEKNLMGADSEVLSEVVRKIGEAHNVLVALSGNPSVDEMAAAIGLSLYLDKIGKNATAIYSGTTPNALEFLKPEETFETTADVLQDFVIALNKDKADHLRYKLDGDYVKIYITPYKTKVSQEDLEFSYDDYNVDLVLALDVANGVDLDAALREHGRIMHDSVIINITTGNPGKLGEIEWNDKSASSVSEMLARLLYKMNVDGKSKLEKEEATAFLTGIVAATDRFSNARTTPETMRIASRLMESGANQQLVSKNITSDVENEMFNVVTKKEVGKSDDDSANLEVEHSGQGNDSSDLEVVDNKKPEDPTKLEVGHNEEGEKTQSDELKETTMASEGSGVVQPDGGTGDSGAEKDDLKSDGNAQTAGVTSASIAPGDDPGLLKDLKAAEASLAVATMEVVPDKKQETVTIEEKDGALPLVASNNVSAGASGVTTASSGTTNEQQTGAGDQHESLDTKTSSSQFIPGSEVSRGGANDEDDGSSAPSGMSDSDSFMKQTPEKVIQPPTDVMGAALPPVMENDNKYGQMLEKALESADGTGESSESVGMGSMSTSSAPIGNPAMMSAPAVTSNPEINGVPEINYMPMPGETVLPPPPTPPISTDVSMPSDIGTPSVSEPIQPAVPVEEPTPTSLGSQPAMQDQIYHPQAADPSAFKIPGM